MWFYVRKYKLRFKSIKTFYQKHVSGSYDDNIPVPSDVIDAFNYHRFHISWYDTITVEKDDTIYIQIMDRNSMLSQGDEPSYTIKRMIKRV